MRAGALDAALREPRDAVITALARVAGDLTTAAKGRFARALLDGGLAAARRFAWEGWRAVTSDDGIDVLAPH